MLDMLIGVIHIMALNDINFDEGGDSLFIIERVATNIVNPIVDFVTEPGPYGAEIIVVYVNILNKIKIYSPKLGTKNQQSQV